MSSAFEAVQSYYERAAERLNLELSLREALATPTREVRVQVRVPMDGGGFKVFPRDVEEALLEHPAITAACVLGRPDPVYGEEVVAFVTAEGEVGEDELVEFGRARLGGYKYPREIHLVDALPLTPIGKIYRKALHAALAVEGGVKA